MRQFARAEILERLRAVRARGEPLVLGGAGTGLVAKAADRAGIDVLMAYNTGPFRMDGQGSLAGYLAYGDANGITLELGRRLLPVVEDTPVVGGIGAADPYRDVERLLDEYLAVGFSGITNVPTAGLYSGDFRRHIDATGLGYPREIDLIRLCRERDVFTVAYAFTPEEASAMAEAGADVVGAHVGLTSGGLIGAEETLSLDEACAATERMRDAAVSTRDDVLIVGHGGPFEDPDSVRALFERVPVDGYLGASSIERIPVERAVAGVVRAFKALRLR
ncbi:MAG: phosphoenolpyruvate hydrolase family protein [Actinobacteria bacterium]|nr:MAG: phosphoenolpyruvate hydrolase family protein [Actinomycetota bacterium]